MDKIDALINEIQGVDTDGPYRYNGLTYEEWIQEGRDYVKKHGSKKGWKNNKWIRPDGEELELYSTKSKKTTKAQLANAEHMKPRKTSISKAFQAARKEREKVPERLRSRFSSDAEFQKFKDYVDEGVSQNIDLTRAQSVEGKEFDHGHLKALGADGSNDPADQRLENRASNRATQQNADPTDAQLRRTGHATNWDEAVDYYLEGRPANYFDLTPQDKQRIWTGEDPDVVVGSRKEAIKKNPLAKPAPQRHRRLQKLGMKRNPTSELGFAAAPDLTQAAPTIRGSVKQGAAGMAIDAGVNYLSGMDSDQAVVEALAGPIDESNIGMTPTMGAEMRTLEDGRQVGYDPKLNRLMGEGVEGQGLAYKDGKPVAVERGSVAGHKSMADMALETGQQLAENAPGQMAKLLNPLPEEATNWLHTQGLKLMSKFSDVGLTGNTNQF